MIETIDQLGTGAIWSWIMTGPVYILPLVVAFFGALLVMLVYWLASSGHVRSGRHHAGFGQGRLLGRRLFFRPFEADDWGMISEVVRHVLVRELWRPGQWRRGFPSLILGEFAGAGRFQDAGQGGFDSLLTGVLKGRRLDLAFAPSEPVFQIMETDGFTELSGAGVNVDLKNKDGQLPDKVLREKGHWPSKMVGAYACFDFPLIGLEGLTAPPGSLQQDLIALSVNGLMMRGAGLESCLMSAGRLRRTANRLAASLEGFACTQVHIYHQSLAVTAWSFMALGLMEARQSDLERALLLFEKFNQETDPSQGLKGGGNDRLVIAGLKANEAVCAFALAQLRQRKRESGAGHKPEQRDDWRHDQERQERALYQRAVRAASAGLRTFRTDNFPGCHGALLVVQARAQAALSPDGALTMGHVDFPAVTETSEDAAGLVRADGVRLQAQLDQIIRFFRQAGHSSLIGPAGFVKGVLALHQARRHIGLQDWERAENALLTALADAHDNAPWWSISRVDIQFELGQLYSDWGQAFGERYQLEKAMHHYMALLESKTASRFHDRARLGLARAQLALSGITNEPAAHRRAIERFEGLQKSRQRANNESEISRSLGVARARLALCVRDVVEARLAVSEISAVLGHNQGVEPPRDVLLRLRARLREMLFLIEGDDVSLDRAIADRRELLSMAGAGVSELKWAVEVGDLVAVLSRRQYQASGAPRDFHEAHYLLEKALSICDAPGGDDALGDHYPVQHVKAGLYLQSGRLLSTFARVQFDLPAMNEAVTAFETYLSLMPRSLSGDARADALQQIGQIMMDLSAHHGQHDGLARARRCFAEAFDIYVEKGKMDQANRMRRFMENAEAALLAYQGGEEPRALAPPGT